MTRLRSSWRPCWSSHHPSPLIEVVLDLAGPEPRALRDADRDQVTALQQAVERLPRDRECLADLANGQKRLKIRPGHPVISCSVRVHAESPPAPERLEISADRVSESGFWWPWLDDETERALTELAATSVELGRLRRLNDGLDRAPVLERLQGDAEPGGRIVLARVGALLAEREGELLEPQLRRQIRTAHEIVRACLGERRAKQLQFELSDGNPLTVCFGRSLRETGLKPPHHIVGLHNGDGCGLVCADSMRDFRETCEGCRGRQFRREARTIASDMRDPHRPRGLPILGDVDGVPTTLWEGWCADCGTHFIASERQTKLCDSCGKGRA
jgi:hypothetical protein